MSFFFSGFQFYSLMKLFIKKEKVDEFFFLVVRLMNIMN